MLLQRRGRSSALRIAFGLGGMFLARASFAQDRSYPTIRLSAFADVLVSHSTRSGVTTFDFGELDPLAEVQFSEKWSAVGEGLAQRLERGPDADVSGGRRVELNVERLFLAYNPSDSFRFQAGEVNTGIVEWNEREHLPRFLQTPVDVPSIAKRQEQGGAWPMHLIGGWISGYVPGAAGLRYGAGVGASRGRSRDDTAPLTGPTSPAGLLSLSFAPQSIEGLEFGGAALLDDIPAPEGTYRELDETLSTSYVRGPFEVRGEWSRMNHRPRSGGATRVTQGWYALFSARLPGALRELRPYALLDRLDVASDEPYLADVHDQRAWSAGIRWDATRQVVLKLDYRSQRSSSSEFERRVRLQLAVAF